MNRTFKPLHLTFLALAFALVVSAAPVTAIPLCNDYVYCAAHPTGPCACPGSHLVTNCLEWVGLCQVPPPPGPGGEIGMSEGAFLDEVTNEEPEIGTPGTSTELPAGAEGIEFMIGNDIIICPAAFCRKDKWCESACPEAPNPRCENNLCKYF
jgi:hypothetical protein